MKKIKLIFLLTIFLAFNNCGYVPLFSNNNYDFSIQDIEIKGDKDLGTKISNKFEIFQNLLYFLFHILSLYILYKF